jgi:ribosomal protein S18 acetylase RimI-like enzyme
MINFRHAEQDDLSAVVDLLYEVEAFYGAVELPPREAWAQQVARVLFGAWPAARVLLAGDDRPLGFASYSFLWPAAGVSSSLFVKELYVRKAHRGRGVGAGLMAELSSIAVEAGCSRMEWTTDADNHAAQAFYARLDSTPTANKVLYRVEGAGLLRLAHLQPDA